MDITHKKIPPYSRAGVSYMYLGIWSVYEKSFPGFIGQLKWLNENIEVLLLLSIMHIPKWKICDIYKMKEKIDSLMESSRVPLGLEIF